MFGLACARDNVSKLLKVFGVIKITFEKIAHNLKKSSLKLVLLINASNLEFEVNQKKRFGKEAKCVILLGFFFRCIMCNLKYRFLLSSIFPSLT